jgi:hypothetical protein
LAVLTRARMAAATTTSTPHWIRVPSATSATGVDEPASSAVGAAPTRTVTTST